MSSTSIGAGNVEITLVGEKVTLRPTLRAMQTISKGSGGIIGAINDVAKFDFETIVNVVAIGLNKTAPGDVKDIAERVYENGITDLIEPLTNFLVILANGGRPVEKTVDENPQ
jgi:hypothetical protein